ncbi:DNA mismatch repair endonuclease MutL [Anaerotalea alkaliphila]|uniref:DNA mismatch repair protein MutL n=1 Tax=Anaerotalea alkaliphila TaxID=2662126 RepID=A0A7X5KNU2_9FIRM|nr:DNA mismatch repair endonuclease MutL [Anaerotalea alkaliphila]NDL68163.1 DNA mismatch repair endonuclease MutL [Anaerotalea alkaliphila]
MGKIHLLEQSTINKIAAGEVVERPASIVKELVENSIDAGAADIAVEIREGGTSLIRVTDNGEGIPSGEVPSAFLRHATSKISRIEDLEEALSLGFRGEALASIAAVSILEIITKTPEALTGVRYGLEGGAERFREEIGCPAGTTLLVGDLFFNVPARKKFLKSPATEASYVSDAVTRLALAHPGVGFKFINNGQTRFQTPGNGKLQDAVFAVFGKDTASKLLPVRGEKEGMRITGFVGKPETARGNRSYEYYHVNGRSVRSKVVQRALEDAFKTKLPLHKYPFSVFQLELDPGRVDVNVHPTKMEVRFKDDHAVYTLVHQSVSTALLGASLTPELSAPTPLPAAVRERTPEPFETVRREEVENLLQRVEERMGISMPSDSAPPGETSGESFGPRQEILEDAGVQAREQLADAVLVGQLFGTYWLASQGDRFYIIDQHAAHERVLYDRLLAEVERGQVHSQVLLEPLVVELHLGELEVYKRHAEHFKTLGFEVEQFGSGSVLVRSVPYVFSSPMGSGGFLEILDGLEADAPPDRHQRLLEEVAGKACKAAVKAHDKLSRAEYAKLVEDLFSLENPYTCPHGRPTMISMSQYELEKKFKRIQ